MECEYPLDITLHRFCGIVRVIIVVINLIIELEQVLIYEIFSYESFYNLRNCCWPKEELSVLLKLYLRLIFCGEKS